MVNLIGHIPEAARQLQDVALHDYGKSERPDRKLGHITVVADSADDRNTHVGRIGQIVT
jgi:5-(carboxyamino)imidazole ribonucleotide synthase